MWRISACGSWAPAETGAPAHGLPARLLQRQRQRHAQAFELRLDGPGCEPVRLQRLARVLKLVGVAGGAPRILAFEPDTEQARSILGRMRGEARGTEQFVIGLQRQSREGMSGCNEWQDIMLQPRDGAPGRNLSRSDGIDCAQPALDARGERVAYILTGG